MKIEIDTNTDVYELWKKVRELVEDAYQEPIRQENKEKIAKAVKWGTGDPKLQNQIR